MQEKTKSNNARAIVKMFEALGMGETSTTLAETFYTRVDVLYRVAVMTIDTSNVASRQPGWTDEQRGNLMVQARGSFMLGLALGSGRLSNEIIKELCEVQFPDKVLEQ